MWKWTDRQMILTVR